MRKDTLIQHLGEESKPHGAVVPPIFQNSLYTYESYEEMAATAERLMSGDPEAFFYARHGNPTLNIVEKKIAALEGVDRCKIFVGGMAAITSAIFACVEHGSHIVCLDTCYGPTRRFISDYLPKFGVTSTFVDGLSPESVIDAIRAETTLVYLESPSSIIFRLQDFERITTTCRQKGITTITDNSYASPLFQQPASFGVDVIVHSATKYLAGHSDITAGVVAGSDEFIRKLIHEEIDLIGGVIPPFPAWLLLRGMRTLRLRMNHAEQQGNAMAKWLKEQSWVDHVFHVGNPDFDQRALRDKQMSGSSSLLSFLPKNQDQSWIERFINRLKTYQRGVSWGGFESLCVAVPFQPIDWAEKQTVIRLYCGLEDIQDLMDDVAQAAEN